MIGCVMYTCGCQVDSAGNHEWRCPLRQSYINLITYEPEVDQPTDEDCGPRPEYHLPAKKTP